MFHCFTGFECSTAASLPVNNRQRRPASSRAAAASPFQRPRCGHEIAAVISRCACRRVDGLRLTGRRRASARGGAGLRKSEKSPAGAQTMRPRCLCHITRILIENRLQRATHACRLRLQTSISTAHSRRHQLVGPRAAAATAHQLSQSSSPDAATAFGFETRAGALAGAGLLTIGLGLGLAPPPQASSTQSSQPSSAFPPPPPARPSPSAAALPQLRESHAGCMHGERAGIRSPPGCREGKERSAPPPPVLAASAFSAM